MKTTEFKPLKMRISNRFDAPCVLMGGVYYFPQDESYLKKRDGILKASIQCVFNDGKLKQDTFYICPIVFLEMLEYWVKKTK